MKKHIKNFFSCIFLASITMNCNSLEDEVITLEADAGFDQLELSNYGYKTAIAANELLEGQSGEWKIVRGENGVFEDAFQPNTIFFGEPGELYTLEWELTQNNQYITDWIDVSFKSLSPQILSTFEDTIRNTFTLNLEGDSTFNGEDNQWSLVGNDSSGHFTSPNSPTTEFIGLPASTYTLEWKHSFGSKKATDQITVTFDSLKAYAGDDSIGIVIKEDAYYYTLQAQLPKGAKGEWTILEGNKGNVITPTLPHSLFTGIPNEKYVLEWKLEHGSYISKDTVTLSFGGIYHTWTDSRDNKTYKTIHIGELEWMAENFDFEFYTGEASWYYGQASEARITTGKPLTTDEERRRYGRLYTYVGASLATPEGWRLPTYEEYWSLVERFNGQSYAGDSFREGGDSGLNLIMGGFFEPHALRWDPHFGQMEQMARYWVSLAEDQTPETSLGNVLMMNETPIVGIGPINIGYAVSVRYVRDIQK